VFIVAQIAGALAKERRPASAAVSAVSSVSRCLGRRGADFRHRRPCFTVSFL